MAPDIPALQSLARMALARRTDGGEAAPAVALAARRAYLDLAAVTVPLIGQVGVDALMRRALHLEQKQFPASYDTAGSTETPFASAMASLERQDAVAVKAAAAAVLATFVGLLTTFIGAPLTARLMRRAWPDTSSDARTQETSG